MAVNVLIFVSLFLNIAVGIGLFIMWMAVKGPAKDDPRLSRGLQLLQNKISVLEDLSDQTDVQVKKLVHILDQKGAQVQRKIKESEKQILKINESMKRSLDVADVFQDKIPHQEIINRQNSIKYVQAAQMAHQGKPVSEIVERLGLPEGEVRFITKINKDKLVFDENQLPQWAVRGLKKHTEIDETDTDLASSFYASNLSKVSYNDDEMKKLGDKFKAACKQENNEPVVYEPEQI
ncbi:MAG: DUF2802 domain-containing protein [Bdellovibrionaceae bacterium]|jgi:hypothetical protein|nr:DUF2802 domain-containing protein [Pseudobdellovibrionaceae bacterium]